MFNPKIVHMAFMRFLKDSLKRYLFHEFCIIVLYNKPLVCFQTPGWTGGPGVAGDGQHGSGHEREAHHSGQVDCAVPHGAQRRG